MKQCRRIRTVTSVTQVVVEDTWVTAVIALRVSRLHHESGLASAKVLLSTNPEIGWQAKPIRSACSRANHSSPACTLPHVGCIVPSSSASRRSDSLSEASTHLSQIFVLSRIRLFTHNNNSTSKQCFVI